MKRLSVGEPLGLKVGRRFLGIVAAAVIALSSLVLVPQQAGALETATELEAANLEAVEVDSAEEAAVGDGGSGSGTDVEAGSEDAGAPGASEELLPADTPAEELSSSPSEETLEGRSGPNSADAQNPGAGDPDDTLRSEKLEDDSFKGGAQVLAASACRNYESEKPSEAYGNDGLWKADTLPVGSTICGYIAGTNDVDFFKFATSAGTYRLTFKFDDPKVSGNAYKVRVYDTNDEIVKSWNITGAAAKGGWLSKQLTRLPSGTGYVEIVPLDKKTTGKKYSLSVAKVSGAAADTAPSAEGCLAEKEKPSEAYDNDGLWKADTLPVGSTICGYIAGTNDVDFYALNVAAGAYVVNLTFNNAYDPPSTYYFTLKALNSDGDVLRTWKLNAGDWRGKAVEVKYPKGAGYVVVSTDTSTYTGEPYKLTVSPAKKGAFVDVAASSKFFNEIQWMHKSGISTGTKTAKGLVYQPSSSVSRQQMAAFLFRQSGPKNYKAPKVSPFADVPTSHKFYKEIAWMAESKVSVGYKKGNKSYYKPSVVVSRSAMAAFLHRLHGPSTSKAPSAAPFVDVPRNHKYAKEIAWMKSAKISTGSKTSKGMAYKPNSPISRAEMAAFLYRINKL